MMKKILIGRVVFLPALIAIMFIFCNTLNAQNLEYKRFVGRWVTGPLHENYLKIGENYILVYLNIEEVDGVLFTRMESPDADVFNMPGDETTTSGKKIKIYFEPIDAIYKGEINKANNQITGALAFLGKTVPMSLVKVLVESHGIK